MTADSKINNYFNRQVEYMHVQIVTVNYTNRVREIENMMERDIIERVFMPITEHLQQLDGNFEKLPLHIFLGQ